MLPPRPEKSKTPQARLARASWATLGGGVVKGPWPAGAEPLAHPEPFISAPDFFQGRPSRGLAAKDQYWLTPAGTEVSEQDWTAGNVCCLGMGLPGNQIDETGTQGDRGGRIEPAPVSIVQGFRRPSAFGRPAAWRRTPG